MLFGYIDPLVIGFFANLDDVTVEWEDAGANPKARRACCNPRFDYRRRLANQHLLAIDAPGEVMIR